MESANMENTLMRIDDIESELEGEYKILRGIPPVATPVEEILTMINEVKRGGDGSSSSTGDVLVENEDGVISIEFNRIGIFLEEYDDEDDPDEEDDDDDDPEAE